MELSVVIPCFNEQDVIQLLRARLVAVLDSLGVVWEVLLVDDGSLDGTYEILCSIHREDPRFKIISLARNFGQQAAVAAGLHYSEGAVVAVMDADLQDPPEVLRECLERWRAGYEVVFAVRTRRKEGLFWRLGYGGFYRLLSAVAEIRIPLDSGDFCLMDRKVVDVICRMPERNMFIRGMRAWSGFRQIGLAYERKERAGGRTKYSVRKLCRLALDGIFSFSTLPLRIAGIVGVGVVAINVFGILFVVAWRVGGFEFMGHRSDEIPGWAGAFTALLFFAGIQLLMLGLLGEYMGRIYEEVKRRPRWVVRARHGLSVSERARRCPIE